MSTHHILSIAGLINAQLWVMALMLAERPLQVAACIAGAIGWTVVACAALPGITKGDA